MTLSQISSSFNGIPPFEIGFDLELESFSISQRGGDTIISNGDVILVVSNHGQDNIDVDLSGDEMDIESNGVLETLTDYNYILSYESNDDFSYTLSGTLTSARFDDTFTFSHITPFSGNNNVSSGFPSSGELHVIATSDNSQAYCIPQPDGINIQINIDMNGDAIIDETVMSTWSEFQEI
jgi:hypothetical protein